MLDTMLHDITIRDLTLDLSGVTFMDSAGLGVILGRYRIAEPAPLRLPRRLPGPNHTDASDAAGPPGPLLTEGRRRQG